MTEFGANGDSLPTTGVSSYRATTIRTEKTKRIKLALFLCSLAACLGVALLGMIVFFCAALVRELTGFDIADQYGNDFLMGLQMGIGMAAYNFILFFITVPAAWIALGFSIGQFPRRRITHRMPYLRWATIWGVLLVAGTTTVFGTIIGGVLGGLGAAVPGILIGAIAGLGCGYLFHAIVQPAKQATQVDVDVFE